MKQNLKKISGVVIAAGVLLLIGAAILFGITTADESRAADSVQRIVDRLVEVTRKDLNTSQTGEKDIPNSESTEEKESAEPVIEIDGTPYLGYLSFTGYDLTLPVIADWSFDALQYAPARFSGTVEGNDLVIAAHNYFSHFYLLNNMVEGNEVILTLADGTEIRYIVQKTETLSPIALNDLTAGDYDLTLFTCTPTGLARATVRCGRIN